MSAAIEMVTGTVQYVNRKGHTVYGNPIMEIAVTDDGDGEWCEYDIYRISDNASLVYEVENPEFRDEPHTFALTVAGRISHVVR